MTEKTGPLIDETTAESVTEAGYRSILPFSTQLGVHSFIQSLPVPVALLVVQLVHDRSWRPSPKSAQAREISAGSLVVVLPVLQSPTTPGSDCATVPDDPSPVGAAAAGDAVNELATAGALAVVVG